MRVFTMPWQWLKLAGRQLQISGVKGSGNHAWKSTYTSSASFFENKHGFAQHHTPKQMSGLVISSMHNTQCVAPFFLHYCPCRKAHSQNAPVPLYLQRRFSAEDNFSLLKNLKLKMGKQLNASSPSLLDKYETTSSQAKIDPGLHPEFSEDHMVAYAEGYQAAVKPADESITKANIRSLITLGLLVAIVLTALSSFVSVSRFSGIQIQIGKQASNEDILVTFDDVIGMEEAKEELQHHVDFLKNPEKYESLGARLPKGVLLVGPPGVGKTLLARAVAGEAGVPFFHASGSEFDEVFVGQGARRLRNLFRTAKHNTPCILFIDEIDSVGSKRTSSEMHPYANQTINQLLSEMDGFDNSEEIIVLGATNRRDNLDKALLRPGRFDAEVQVFAPDLKERTKMLEHYMSKVKAADDLDLHKLAKGTIGCTGADLANLVNQAAIRATLERDELITLQHLEWARDKTLMGAAKKTRIADEEVNQMTACHEAGHAIVSLYTTDATPLNKVTILPRGMSLGHTSFLPEKEQYMNTRSQLLAQMDVAMGGHVAEELVYGVDGVTTGASSDFQQATSIATSMVKHYGMSEKVGMRYFQNEEQDEGTRFVQISDLGHNLAELVDLEIKRFIQESYERAKHILRTHQGAHEALTAALVQQETLDITEVHEICNIKPSTTTTASHTEDTPQQ